MVTSLARTNDAFTPAEIAAFVRRSVGEGLLDTTEEYATQTLHLTAEAYVEAARTLKEDGRLAFVMFDCLFGVDVGEDGFDVCAILYSVETGIRVVLRHRCAGGRGEPVAPTLTHLFHGADWHERETWDMFGIEFEGHPGLAPRILCAENFEGWPLRKDFYLATREAKPWPGVKEPAELDEEGNVIERVPGPGDAPGPTALDEAMAKQAKLANPEPEPEELAATTVESSDDAGAATPSEASQQPDERAVEGDDEAVGETLEEAESQARRRAEEKRKQAAEARAHKAAERSEEGPATTPEEDATPAPEGHVTGHEGAGGPPSGPPTDTGSTGESTVEGGLSETVDEARERGEAIPDPDEAPIRPEGHDPDHAPDQGGDQASDGDDPDDQGEEQDA